MFMKLLGFLLGASSVGWVLTESVETPPPTLTEARPRTVATANDGVRKTAEDPERPANGVPPSTTREDAMTDDPVDPTTVAARSEGAQPNPSWPEAAPEASPAPTPAVSPSPEPRWHRFWQPFGNAASAQGFAGRLGRVTGLRFRVEDPETGHYRIALAYTDAAELAASIALIEAQTGLDATGDLP